MSFRKFLRQTTVVLAIAAVAPLGLAVLDLAPIAAAGEKGNGHANDHSDGKGGGKGNSGGQGKSEGQGKSGANQSANAGTDLNKGQAKKAEMMEAKATRQAVAEDPSMHPSALGKLNGVLNASPNALMNASPNSPIGMAGTTLKEALKAAELANSDADLNNNVTQEQLAAQLAGIFEGMTNKTLTGPQVLAVLDRMAEIDPSLSEYDFDVPQGIGVAEANAALAGAVATEVNSFDLAEAMSKMFDDDEEEVE